MHKYSILMPLPLSYETQKKLLRLVKVMQQAFVKDQIVLCVPING